MARYKLNTLTMPNYGPCVIEDFVPYSDSRALVSAGKHYRALNFILDVGYIFDEGLTLYEPIVRETGSWLRLGHYHNGMIVYSEGGSGPHQPFMFGTDCYYTDNAPHAKLYKNGRVLIDHWGDVAELGNAFVDDLGLIFEARRECQAAPSGWALYSADHDGKKVKYLCNGANPAIYNGTVYYGIWAGTQFDIATMDRRDCLPADPYIPA
jgi:hypothetical protein